jgi:hypothetical protein
MKEQLEQHVKRVKELHELCCGNEQQTKQSLIAPLFAILGYDMTDPRECKPEYRMDFGKGEKAATPVDWAFLKDGAFAFFVEAKEAGAKLARSTEQLRMYFGKEPGVNGVKLGILTNGTQWLFFTDLLNDNAMDTEPFLIWNVLEDVIPLDFLTILQKSQYKQQVVRTFAKKKQHTNLLVTELDRLLEPSPEFIKLAVQRLESRNLKEKVLDEWKPILVNAIQEWVKQYYLRMVLKQPVSTGPTLVTKQDGNEPPDESTEGRMKPGTILTRFYKGKDFKVTVTADGYRYEGKDYKSLTALAKEITGYKVISGPAFFANADRAKPGHIAEFDS